jgi:ribosomal-protein-alanine N-acetyltransferase
METLSTTGLTLEPLVEAHAAEMFDILSDPAIYQFENQPPKSKQALAERYARLQLRYSPDGSEHWLNWVIRLETGQLCGYVQATVRSDQSALIAYELASHFWNQKIGSRAVAAMIEHVAHQYRVRQFVAIFKRANFRSEALLHSLGFIRFNDESQPSLEPDEKAMYWIEFSGVGQVNLP